MPVKVRKNGVLRFPSSLPAPLLSTLYRKEGRKEN